jgi:HlyD family secretion protein
VGEVVPGQKATFTVQAFPNRTFVGKVRQIREGPITVQNVVTYDVVVDVPNEDFKLLPGMTADAHIITAERLNVLRVPLPAIRFTPEGLAHEAGESGAEHAHRGSGEAPAAGPGGPGAQHGHGHAGRGAPRARVWVVRAGKLIPVQVRTGLDDGTLVEVAGEDLKEGDIVVVNAVRPNEPKPEGGERPPGGNPYRPGAGAGGFRP